MLGLAKEAVLFGGTSLLARLLPLLAGKVSPIFDPSDLSSMYQSSTGGTAVAAHADPVGLHLDSQYFGGLSAAAYIAAATELRGNGAVGLVGSATAATYNTSTGAATVNRVDASNQSYVQWSGLTDAGRLYAIDIENTGASTVNVRSGSHTGTAIAVSSGVRATVFLASATGLITITASGASTPTFTVRSFKAVPGYHRSQATGTKRPLYDTSTGKPGLKYDGTDDCLVTPSIDYSGGDSVTVVAAVRKLSDAAVGTVCEFSANASSTAGSFSLAAPSSVATDRYQFRMGGSTSVAALASGYAAPTSNVVTGLGDVSSDTCLLRVGGVQVSSSSSDQGTGNLNNQAVNYGARNNGASLAFNGIEFWSLVSPTNDNTILTLAEQIATSKLG